MILYDGSDEFYEDKKLWKLGQIATCGHKINIILLEKLIETVRNGVIDSTHNQDK